MAGNNTIYNKDKIFIRDLRVFASHGVLEEEKSLGQLFLLDADLTLNMETAMEEDDLNQSTDYGKVCQMLEEEMTGKVFDLIESLADYLCQKLLLEFPRIDSARIQIKKPQAPLKNHLKYVSVEVTRGWHRAYVGVGSNLGDRRSYIREAMDKMKAFPGIRSFRSAAIQETEPVGYTDQGKFLNTVWEFETWYSPARLLSLMFTLENEAGRKRDVRWGPRTLDLDLLLYDDLVTSDPELVIPHPLMHERAFVLEPLCELSPYGVHPLYQRRFRDLLAALK